MNSGVLPAINELDRKAISLLRILAIFSVITAHVNNVSMVNGTIGWIVACFWDAFGQVGVVCFFILGGFLYHREVGDGKEFAKKKFISIIIPWLLSACLTYALSCILNHHIDFIGALKWIMGFGTWYYYVTVFLVFLFLFKAIWHMLDEVGGAVLGGGLVPGAHSHEESQGGGAGAGDLLQQQAGAVV